jgi:ankyrin repeat protein
VFWISINNRYIQGVNSLMIASFLDLDIAVQWLLEDGTDIGDVDEDGKCALFRAILNESEATLRVLLGQGTEINRRGLYNWTPSAYAVLDDGFSGAVKLLLDAGAQVDAQDEDGCTPLNGAASVGHEAVAKMLDASAQVDA